MSIFDELKIDCHNHIFDPARFPYLDTAIYRPSMQEIGTAAQFTRVLDACGVRHALLVGPTSGYRTDNRCMLDAIASSNGRFKGIAVVENDISRPALQALRDAGVVGVAFNPNMEGTEVFEGVEPLFELLNEFEMFAQIQIGDAQILELLPLIERSGTRFLIDHCGRPVVDKGLDQPAFKALLKLADTGRVTMKLSGLQKYSNQEHPYEDTHPFFRALLGAYGADQCVWGSDWPFLRSTTRMDYAPLLALFEKLVPSREDRQRILWNTPCRLFGFNDR
ncbi:amidohydrolase family protein [Burkholderia anthina]|uniref:amidohydrolase family protein n=1 Tax=Burkholderia anthina TaxID=179879 RepID=UPI001CF235EA|nr:amidohydrolase family protein [Burkholderia anthina]MCA8093453.1 amidohydrolase family protein [Burkholderia anthina]